MNFLDQSFGTKMREGKKKINLPHYVYRMAIALPSTTPGVERIQPRKSMYDMHGKQAMNQSINQTFPPLAWKMGEMDQMKREKATKQSSM